MTLDQLDHSLYIDLLILATRGEWEAYPMTVTVVPDAWFSELLMWLTLGDEYGQRI
jgi:hypothetical protein